MPALPSRPASVNPIVALADQCVQCGLCLPACPTYAVERLEAESPRGRIALARAIALSTIAPTPAGEGHLDHCLACRNCEAACPAHVQFGALLIQARAAQRIRRPADIRLRLLEALVERRWLLGVVLQVYRQLAPVLPRVLRLLPIPPPKPAPAQRAASAAKRTRIALFTGCVAGAYEPRVRAALRTLCDALDVDVIEPEGAVCCGALHAHSGATRKAAALARGNRDAFSGLDCVLTLATGCHGAVADALGGTTTHDALAWLALRANRLAFRSTPRRIGLHVPCTQRNVARSTDAMRHLLGRIDGVEIVELDPSAGCCGASGTQMLLDPPRATRLRGPVLRQAREAGVDAIASANLGCRLHLANGTACPVIHPLELLAETLVRPLTCAARTLDR